jgi:cobalt-zinc-cadmium efflux system outer membrane protein
MAFRATSRRAACRPLARLGLACLAVAWLGACTPALQRPDVAGDAARATAMADPITFVVHGQPDDVPPDAAGRLSRADAVRLCLRNSPDVQVALADVRRAEADARQARLLPNPILVLIVRFPEGGGDPVITADLAADLIAAFQVPRRTRAADRRLRAAASAALTVVLDALTEVEQTYAAAQAADAHVAAFVERRGLIDRLLQLAEARRAAGEGTVFDVATVQAQRIDLESEIAGRELARDEQRLALARLIGRPSDAATWALDAWPATPPPAVAGAESAWVAAALEHRPEVQSGRWELAALGDEAALAAWSPFAGGDVGAEAERDDGWSAGPAFTAPLPLFDFGQARRAAADADRTRARHALTKTRRAVVQDVRTALVTYAASRAALARVESELIPLQQRRRDLAEASYRAGEINVLDVLAAEQDLEEVREQRVDLRGKAAAALIKLHRAAGGPGVAAAIGPTPEAALPPANPPAAASPQP